MQTTYTIGDAILIKKINNTIQTNDVVYFKFPIQDSSQSNTYLFQRVIGLPGDSIELIDKTVFINRVKFKDSSTIKHNFHIKSKVPLDSVYKIKCHLTEGGVISEKNDYSYSLTFNYADSVSKQEVIEKIELERENNGSFDFSCFPYSTQFKWNMDYYGKLYIPKKNDKLILDTITIYLYKNLIEKYENNKLEIKRDSIFINNQLTTTYTVEENYYFTLGDNRDNANDSRKWGFLPASCIIGKAIYLIKKAR